MREKTLLVKVYKKNSAHACNMVAIMFWLTVHFFVIKQVLPSTGNGVKNYGYSLVGDMHRVL